ncbi:Probable Co/Zn/Cd efflux system membrane fusion protein [hydrothermal vent metagenome]|uniref:Probable Co/Zn/Cd efflux system membrane fusion protein n=1 Tax=hydrothermal vent metagenome TaxID=652676 RepID=A0A3B1C063_9ZZZZ
MNKQIIVTALLSLTIGAGISYIVPRMGAKQPQQGAAQKADSNKERKPLYYRHPMNPANTSPVPAKDSMGMDYIPVYATAGKGSGPAGVVEIDPVVTQSIGVRTARAVKKKLTHNIRTVGLIDYDEKRVTRLHPKVEGWVEELYVDTTGEHVKKNTMLLAIYSPELVSTEEEYLLALKNLESLKNSVHPDIRKGAQNLLRSSLERLQLFDVPDHQIKEIERGQTIVRNMHIQSPFDGIVVKIGVREGQYVTPATELYKIADLSTIWIYVDIYEDEMPWVRTGDMAEMKVTGIPGKTFTGKVTYIYPYLDSKTRTNKIRLEFKNPGRALKPDMFANVTLLTSKQLDAVAIPSEAIIRTGKRDQVFIVTGPGRFEPREVTLGVSTNGEVQIVEGVEAGEEVVTSAQFLIDSESKLNEATAKMMEPKGSAGKQDDPDMKGMDMQGMDLQGMDKKNMRIEGKK